MQVKCIKLSFQNVQKSVKKKEIGLKEIFEKKNIMLGGLHPLPCYWEGGFGYHTRLRHFGCPSRPVGSCEVLCGIFESTFTSEAAGS